MPNTKSAKSQPPAPVQPKKSRRWAWLLVLGGAGIIILLLITTIAGCWHFFNKKDSEQVEQPKTQEQVDFSNQLDLMILLEDNFALEDMVISQNKEDLLVRCKAPTIKGKELTNGLVQVFAFINQKVPDDIKTIKLIFTINHVDSAIIRVKRKDISRWMNNKISNVEFINSFDVTSLIK